MNKSWNPVLNKFLEIKESFIKMYGEIEDYSYGKDTCFERWVSLLNNQEHIRLIAPLQFTQYGDLLLIRYANYANISNNLEGGDDITLSEFWDLYDGFYLECRSVVINVRTNELVLTPFKKFRNLNECEETSEENIRKLIENAKCVEFSNKLDGSMQVARYYNGQYIMSGSMALDPENSWRLEDGYSMLGENYREMLKNFSNLTFIFEYVSLKDAHVVKYEKEEEGLYLIGIRNAETGFEYPYGLVKILTEVYNVKGVEPLSMDLDCAISLLPVYSSSEKEGFVLNIDGFKVKIKCDDYVHMHKLLDYISSANVIIKSIGDDTFDDLISKVPGIYKDGVLKVSRAVRKYILETSDICTNLYENAPKDSIKDFMIWVDSNVEKKYIKYVKEMYYGKEINYIKKGDGSCASYKKLKDMGINITEVFDN
jgi:hypothetical protein